MSNIHSRMVKSVKIYQQWNEVKDITTEIGNINPPNHPAFIIGSVTWYRQNHITQKLPELKWMTSLKSAADTIQFITQKAMQMETGAMMHIYKPYVYPFTKYNHLKETFYTDTLYGKVPPLLEDKLSQVFTSREFIFVAPIK